MLFFGKNKKIQVQDTDVSIKPKMDKIISL